MSQRTRIVLAAAALWVLVAAILGVEAWRRRAGDPALAPGSIPIYLEGRLLGGFTPADLDRLDKVTFVDPTQGKTQEGWLLRDVIGLCTSPDQLRAESSITVSSSSRGKSATLTWASVQDPANRVLLDLTNRGTLKLASLLPELDSREEWVQDVDRIEIHNP